MTHGEFDIPLGAQILSIDSKRIRVKGDDNEEYYISHQQVLKTMHITSSKGVDDMISLGDLQEYAILRNLHIRYNAKQIYVSLHLFMKSVLWYLIIFQTYTGTMLIAINPYEFLPIYTNALIKQYRDKKFGEMPPHIFAIGDNSYNDMKDKRKDQCIVIR